VSASAFVGATLIDGTGAPPLPESIVVVEDGRIACAGRASEIELSEDTRRIDVAGQYLIPGLMDANVHLVLQLDPEVLLRYRPGCYDDLIVEAAQVALKAGITTVFDTWGPLEALRRARDRINSGAVSGSRTFIAGNIIGNGGPWSADFAGNYGEALNPATVAAVNAHWDQGVGEDLPWLPASGVRAAVREYIASSGIDFVKYASSTHKALKFITFSPDSQRAICEEAYAAGMTAQACTITPEALRLAIDAGVDLLQHGNITGRHRMPHETVDLIATRQLPCVALLATERLAAALAKDDQWSDLFGTMDDNARALIKAGAKLLLATDGGVFASSVNTSPAIGSLHSLVDWYGDLGSSHLLWLRAALECGMSPMDALLAATRNIAQAYDVDDRLGTVEPGKCADFVVLDGNPLEDPENYGRIAHVVKSGHLVDRDALPEHPVLTVEDRTTV
jgi:imidazolonepropionase-like amidohydrolase